MQLFFFTSSVARLRSSRPKAFRKKGVLRNFTKLTGKHLCQSLLFNTVAVIQRCSVKKLFLEIPQNSQENTCARVFFFIKKEALALVFSCEFCEISKNTFFHKAPLAAASAVANVLFLVAILVASLFLYLILRFSIYFLIS